MGCDAGDQSAPREPELQCLIRDENEAVELVNDTLEHGIVRSAVPLRVRRSDVPRARCTDASRVRGGRARTAAIS